MRYMTAGESHGPEEVAIIEGIPAGLHLTAEMINEQLHRRQVGYGRGARQKIEQDEVILMAGVRHQMTLGSPIALNVHNRDHNNWADIMDPNQPATPENSTRRVQRPRPGHADLVGGIKYGHQDDLRNVLERSSARETVMRVAVGAVAKALLAEVGVDVHGFVANIGPVYTDMTQLEGMADLEAVRKQSEQFETRTLDAETDAKMRELIDQTKQDRDTVGGTVEVIATGVPVGLGSYVSADAKLDSQIAQALMSINAFKGVAFGEGFAMQASFGSQVMDEIYWDAERGFYRGSNHLGGFEGGMTTGEPIVVKGLVKPIPTLYRPMQSVDIQSHEVNRASIERSDTTAVPTAAVIAEAMVAIKLAEAMLDKFDSDQVARFKVQVAEYRQAVKEF
ncbi:chorismate synthase [Weissella uvarum]|uniref:chorismate synthase n=1 Tax=Weissella uvarum TaxID=1479233 RepID=UPI001960D43F|nr:chorismate synthase [Weissella uvarum]MBM7617170.1 chorismate synthase [Weissella uvarum]MCM0595466.1 chorismate synthase [Weissella uvarum]